jgi:bacterioferritin-associated ferredoxin
MYICICKAITDKQLEEAQKSAKTFAEICRQLGLGSECGACISEAMEEVKKNISQKSE